MCVFAIRVLFLLISANVVYGTGGDIYAEEVQALIMPSKNSQKTYKPDINSDLFVFVRHRETKRNALLLPESPQKLIEWMGIQDACLPLILGYRSGTLHRQFSPSGFYMLTLQKLIFPCHFFL